MGGSKNCLHIAKERESAKALSAEKLGNIHTMSPKPIAGR